MTAWSELEASQRFLRTSVRVRTGFLLMAERTSPLRMPARRKASLLGSTLTAVSPLGVSFQVTPSVHSVQLAFL